MSFLSTPLGVMIGLAVIGALCWFFVFRNWGKQGSGTGPVGGTPYVPPPQNQPPDNTPKTKPPTKGLV